MNNWQIDNVSRKKNTNKYTLLAVLTICGAYVRLHVSAMQTHYKIARSLTLNPVTGTLHNTHKRKVIVNLQLTRLKWKQDVKSQLIVTLE